MRSKVIVWRSKSQQIFYSDSKSDYDSLLDKKSTSTPNHGSEDAIECRKYCKDYFDNVLPPN